ncbi:hypothetical protein [Streptomyces sp. NRRL B-24484]|nr:hypothetical protein [Streptomyces sp. NRRL B-24484]
MVSAPVVTCNDRPFQSLWEDQVATGSVPEPETPTNTYGPRTEADSL